MKKFIIIAAWVTTTEDNFEQGEIGVGNEYDRNDLVGTQFSTIDELIKEVNLHRATKENFIAFDDRIIYNQLEDNEGCMPFESEIESWKKGETKLYSANYNFKIVEIKETQPTQDEIAKIFEINEG